jgi:hypothetical protein
VAARHGTLARNPLQISETVSDPVFYLVRHSRSPAYGRGSTPAATAKDIERAGVRTHRYGYPHRNTERNSGAEQHFCDHQMPSHWSRCMLRFQCSLRRASRSSCHLSHRSMSRLTILSIAIISISPLAITAAVSQATGSGPAIEGAVCVVMSSSLPGGGASSPMPAPNRATCYLQNSRPASVARWAELSLVDETYSRFAAVQRASLTVPR